MYFTPTASRTASRATRALKQLSLKQAGLITLALTLATTLGACASTSTGGGFGQQKADITQSEAYVNSFPDVDLNAIAQTKTRDVFKVGDTADIEVYDVEALSTTYVVDRAGNITFPLIGTIQVAGLTTSDLQQRLVQRYGQDYLRAPSINVKLEAQTLGRVVVDGAVNKPVVFEVDEIISLSEAIAQAEGLDQTATNGSSVFIVRAINGERRVQEVNLRAIRQLGAPDPQIIPDDVIFVQDNAGRVAFREFLRTVPLLNTAVIFATRR